MHTRLAFIAFLLVSNASCAFGGDEGAPAPSTTTATTTTAVKTTTIAHGNQQVYAGAKQFEVILDETAWKHMWTKMHGDQDPAPAAPPVDFRKEAVIAVFAGEKPTTGHSIEITQVEQGAGGTLIATVVEKAPAKDAASGASLTYPFHIVRVARPTTGKVEFKTEAK